MRLSQKAKASLEYIAIGTIVVLGIALGGPLAIEGFNAMFKSWDDSAQTTFAGPFVQAPPKCVCTQWVNKGCPSAVCSRQERHEERSCTPAGCKIESKCIIDNTCCDDWTLTCSPPGDPSCCGLNAANPPGPCFWQDTGVKTQQCGSEPRKYECRSDGRCHFQCVSQPPSPPNTMCPGDNTNLSGSSLSITSILVPHRGCTTTRKCEWEQPCTGTVRVFEGRKCHCNENSTAVVPVPGTIRVAASCPSGYTVVGGWCGLVNPGTNTSIPFAGNYLSERIGNTWECTIYRPGSTSCPSSGCNQPEVRALAHCYPTCQTTPPPPSSIFQANESACSMRVWQVIGGCQACQSNRWCTCSGLRYCSIDWGRSGSIVTGCPYPNSTVVDICGLGFYLFGSGVWAEVRTVPDNTVCNSYLEPGANKGIWFSVNNAPGTLYFCYNNSRSYFRQTPPRCAGTFAAWNAAVPSCSGALKPAFTLMTNKEHWQQSYRKNDGNDRKLTVCCDYENYPHPCYPSGRCS